MTNIDGTVLVAGAGIGGLAAALALRRRNIDVVVYERRTERQVELAGTGLTIWSNATTALRQLGLAEAIRDNGVVIERVLNYRANNSLLYETNTKRYEWPDSFPSISIARGALIRVLLDACDEAGIPIHFGHPITDVSATPDQATIGFSDGRKVSGPLLIAADGVHSVIRQHLVADGPPEYLGVTVFRGISEASGGLVPGTVHMFEAAHRPAVGGMGWHVGDGRVSWTMGRLGRTVAAPSDRKRQIRELLRDVAGPPRALVDNTPEERIVCTDILYRKWTEQWQRGRIVLMGDAAHAMATVFGQGACQALEDAVTLGACLDSAQDPLMGVQAFVVERQERMRWVRSQVMRVAKMQRITNPALLWLRGRLAPMIVPRTEPRLWPGLLRPPMSAGQQYRVES